MNAFRHLLTLYRPYRGMLLAGTGLAAIVLIAHIALMAVSGWFLASMAAAGLAGVAFNYFAPAAFIRGLSILRTAGRYGERLMTHDAVLQISSGLRHKLFADWSRQKMWQKVSMRSGTLYDRLKSDVETVESVYLNALIPVMSAVAGALGVLLVLYSFDHSVASGQGALMIVGGLLLPWFLYTLTIRDLKPLQAAKSEMRAGMAEAIQGIDTILVNNMSASRIRRLLRRHDAMSLREMHLSVRHLSARAAIMAVAQGGAVLALILAYPALRDGSMNSAVYAMLPLLCLVAFDAVSPLLNASAALAGFNLAAPRILGDTPEASTADHETRRSVYALRLRGGAYRYGPGSRRIVFPDFTLMAGERLILCGPSGSGKSTLIQVLAGLRALDEGHLVTFEDVAVAEQRPYIFSGTIRENLLKANPGASEEMLWKVCDTALLSDDIRAMPSMLDTPVGEYGEALSGGQRRRLSIARALLKKAPFLILDEPTEGVTASMACSLIDNITRHAAANDMTLMIVSHDRVVLDRAGFKIVAMG